MVTNFSSISQSFCLFLFQVVKINETTVLLISYFAVSCRTLRGIALLHATIVSIKQNGSHILDQATTIQFETTVTLNKNGDERFRTHFLSFFSAG